MDEWYNAMQAQVNLAKYPPETAKILHRDIFWFFLKDEDFMSRTISDGSVNLDKFPASRVHQLAKKYESSKATVRHIKQVSGKTQATQINLLHHQRTELPQHRYKKKRSHGKPRLGNSKPAGNDQYHSQPHYKNKGNHKLPISNRMLPSPIQIDVQSVVILFIMMASPVLLRNTNARHATSMDILPVNVSKEDNTHNTKSDNPKLIKYM